MPRQAKRLASKLPSQNVSAAEVDAMFRRSTKQGPWPDRETCGLVAAVMNNHHGFFMRTRENNKRRADARKAASVLRKFVDETAGRSEGNHQVRSLPGDLHALDIALKRSEFYFSAPPAHCDWLPMCIVLAEVTAAVLLDIGRKPGHSRGSVLVQFVALALERMGYAGATAPMIEGKFQEHDIRPGSNDPTETPSAIQ